MMEMLAAQANGGRAAAKKEKKQNGQNKKATSSSSGDNYDDDDGNDLFAKLLNAGAPGKSSSSNSNSSNSNGKRERRPAPAGAMDDGDIGGGGGGGDGDEDNLLESFSRKKKKFISDKKEHYKPEARFGGAEDVTRLGTDGKRAASYEIMKNKGLTPHRKKANRNPRVKKKEQYEKKVKARKGQVRDVKTGMAGSYAGELTGIKANVARSRKIY